MTNKPASLSTIITCGVCCVSAIIWLVMNVPFTPRFSLSAYTATRGMYISAYLNLAFGLCLIALRQKKRAFFPFFFAVFPIAYLVTAGTGSYIFGTDFSGPRLTSKLLYDCYFFAIEIIGFFCLAKAFGMNLSCLGSKRREPTPTFFRDPPFTSRLGMRVSNFLIVFFCSVVMSLLAIILMRYKVPAGVLLKLLGLQVLFALLLGFKEEFFFRWLLTNGLVDALKDTGKKLSGLVALLLVAVFWATYHGFFGEGVGSGLVSAGACFIASVFWGFLTLQRGNIRTALLGHFCIELYGVYLMYLPLLADMGYAVK
jgi:membrane protease YdiL (CAAX protease family)